MDDGLYKPVPISYRFSDIAMLYLYIPKYIDRMLRGFGESNCPDVFRIDAQSVKCFATDTARIAMRLRHFLFAVRHVSSKCVFSTCTHSHDYVSNVNIAAYFII